MKKPKKSRLLPTVECLKEWPLFTTKAQRHGDSKDSWRLRAFVVSPLLNCHKRKIVIVTAQSSVRFKSSLKNDRLSFMGASVVMCLEPAKAVATSPLTRVQFPIYVLLLFLPDQKRVVFPTCPILEHHKCIWDHSQT